MDIVSRLPMALAGRTATAGTSNYTLTDIAYDVAIGGQPWLLSVSDERQLTRQLAPMKKDQFDSNREPGEQSLVGWWLRSQSTFIGGEGMLYQDPDQVGVSNLQNRHAIQYGHSVGLNPWTNGQLTLLRSTTQRIADGSASTHFLQGWNDGTDRYWSAVGNVLKSDTGAATTTITWGGANTIRSLTSDGTNYFCADNVQVYKGAGNGAGAAWSATGTTNVLVRFVKGRIMMALDNKVYEVSSAGVQTLKFTHLNAAFVWTDFAEGTNGIFASGYAGSQGAIYKFTLDNTGAIPVLASGGSLTAQLPLGETVLAMSTYLGTYVGLGTSRGFRVGQIDSNGDLVYGPLLITNAAGVRAIGAYDRFFFVAATNAIDASSGLYRVDLGQIIQDSGGGAGARQAYATDLQAHVTGTVCAVTNLGNSDRMAFAVVGQGSYLESASVLEPTGYFQTGRVRFSTIEPKIFKFLTVRTPTSLMGSVTASVTEPGGSTTSILSISQGGTAQIKDVILAAPVSAVEWLQLRLDFARSATDTAQGPTVNGWQLKAMPGAVRQRIFTLPLSCFDFEKDANGQRFGERGRTLDRIQAFEQLAQQGDAVSFQDLANDAAYLCVIDDYKFEQKANPATDQVYGGYLFVQLRTIADVITS